MTDVGDHGLEVLTAGLCPVCQQRGFVLGPRGGVAQNIECASLQCRARFNVTAYAGRIVWAEQIPRQSEGGLPWPSSPPDHGYRGSLS